MAPIPEAIFLVSFSIRQFQLSLSSIVIPSDFVVATCFTRVPLIEIEGEAAMVFGLWPDPISINFVLVIFRVSLFAFYQVCTFNKSSLKHDSMLPSILSPYVRCVSSAYILGSQCDKRFGRSFTYNKNKSGWSLEGHRRSIHGCQIRAHQLSIVVYGSLNTIKTINILIDSQIYHKSQA